MNARELRDEADKMRARAESAKTDALHTEVSANGLKEKGDETSAQLSFSHKDELDQMANEYDKKAEELESEAVEKERQASEIERQQEQIRSEMERQLDELEKQKRDLRGEKIGLF